MIKISKRLEMAASMVLEHGILADVGTDHGYVPIYLMQTGKIKGAIAMDINAGPLERAKEHIMMYQKEASITTRLSDGVEALREEEADSILIAGMGGGLVIHILTEGDAVCKKAKELILQPQSELERVRKFLDQQGYEILQEEMVLEDEKYYPMMRVKYTGENISHQLPKELCYRYGELLLMNSNPVLKLFLLKEQALYQDIYQNLKKNQSSSKAVARINDVEKILEYNRNALGNFK